MRGITIILAFLFPFTMEAQAVGSSQVSLGGDTVITAKLVGLVMHPPDCGIFSFASIQKFSVIDSPPVIKQKVVRIGIACPELIGRDFFVTNQTYRLWISTRNDVPDAILIEEKAKVVKPPGYWVVKVERLN